MLSENDMHAYQRKAVEFIKDKKRCALWLEMGLGKSVSTLTAIRDLSDSFTVSKVLVIAPLRVANSVWKQEASKWQHLKHLRISVCTGSEKNRIKGLFASSDVYVINRENVPWLVEHCGKKWPFDMVVIDEASSFKNASSQRFKALRKILPFTEYFVELTGTPASNGLLDLWAQVFMIDFGQSLGRTMTAYKQRFFKQDYMGYNFEPIEGAHEKIQELVKPFTLSMQAADYLDLPERIDSVEYVELPPKVLKQYKEFEKTLLAELPSGENIEAINAAVLANKLLQYCNGALYMNEAKAWEELHTEKLDALEQLVEDNPNENLLVAYNYQSDLERLKKRFPNAVQLDKDPETVNRWNQGGIKMLLAHPASAGHGLNIQTGGCVAVWFGLGWSLDNDQQFNARLHRQGQTKPVRIIRIVAKGCLDERVMQVLQSKDKTQNDLLKALKP